MVSIIDSLWFWIVIGIITGIIAIILFKKSIDKDIFKNTWLDRILTKLGKKHPIAIIILMILVLIIMGLGMYFMRFR